MGGLDTPLRRDPSGAPALGITDESLDLLVAAYGDQTSGGMHVCLYKWNTSTLAWERWDGKMDTVVSGDLIVAVDGLETLVTATNAALATLTTVIQDAKTNYVMSNYDVASNPTYLGYLDKDGNWFIKRINTTTGVIDFDSGTSAYSTSWTNRASLSYQAFNVEF